MSTFGDDRAFALVALLLLFLCLVVAIVLLGLYRLLHRTGEGLIAALERVSVRVDQLGDVVRTSERVIVGEEHKTRNSVHNLHQAWLGAPQRVVREDEPEPDAAADPFAVTVEPKKRKG